MRAYRSRLSPDFIELSDVLEAVASRVPIEDSDADAHRSLNSISSDDGWLQMEPREPIKRRLRLAQAAGKLLHVLTQPMSQRPEWWELLLGCPVRNDSVCREGLRWLIAQERRGLPTSSAAGRWGNNAAEPLGEIDVAQSRAHQIGFHIDELIKILDQKGILHALRPSNGGEAAALTVDQNALPSEPIRLTRHVLTKRGQVCPIEAEIFTAQSESKDPQDIAEVWLRLCKMAESGRSLKLKPSPTASGGFLVPRKEGWHPYSRKALGSFIRKRRDKSSTIGK